MSSGGLGHEQGHRRLPTRLACRSVASPGKRGGSWATRTRNSRSRSAAGSSPPRGATPSAARSDFQSSCPSPRSARGQTPSSSSGCGPAPCSRGSAPEQVAPLVARERELHEAVEHRAGGDPRDLQEEHTPVAVKSGTVFSSLTTTSPPGRRILGHRNQDQRSALPGGRYRGSFRRSKDLQMDILAGLWGLHSMGMDVAPIPIHRRAAHERRR
jgi:hypothetical protein